MGNKRGIKEAILDGAVSGFFGGLSGHQGAFRSLFLLKADLDRERFIATGVMPAVMVDMSRLLMYGWEMPPTPPDMDWRLAASVLPSIVALGLISGAL
jgi:uncharacterized protein